MGYFIVLEKEFRRRGELNLAITRSIKWRHSKNVTNVTKHYHTFLFEQLIERFAECKCFVTEMDFRTLKMTIVMKCSISKWSLLNQNWVEIKIRIRAIQCSLSYNGHPLIRWAITEIAFTWKSRLYYWITGPTQFMFMIWLWCYLMKIDVAPAGKYSTPKPTHRSPSIDFILKSNWLRSNRYSWVSHEIYNLT